MSDWSRETNIEDYVDRKFSFKEDVFLRKILRSRGKKILVVLCALFIHPLFEISQLIIFTNLATSLVGEEVDSIGFIGSSLKVWTDFILLKVGLGITPALAILLAVLAAISLFVGIGSSYLRSRESQSIKAFLHSEVFRIQLSSSWITHSKADRSVQYQNVKTEPARFTQGMVLPVLDITAQLILGVSIIIYSAITVPSLTLMSFFVFSAVFLLAFKSTGPSLDRFSKLQHKLGWELFRIFGHSLDSFKEMKLYSLEKSFYSRYFQGQKYLSKIATYQQTLTRSSRYLLEGTAFITISGVIALTFVLGFEDENLLKSLSIFGVCLLKLVPVAAAAFSSVSQYKGHRHAYFVVNDELKKGYELLDEIKIRDEDRKQEIEHFNKIELRDVSFSYKQEPFIKDVSLIIEKGKAYGIVGSSGSGKTTLIDLISGLIRPDSGSIFINDINSNFITKESWNNKLGLVMQDVNLFNGTFKENIIFFNDREGEDLDRELMKICQQTSLAELMEERDGLQTMVGDDGLQLSGGQKQRLGIARAIYRKAEVLIFDEATSALDSVTEEEVLETFNKLKGNATTISIAHRVQTLKNVDEIWVLNNGKIEAKGSYNQLKEQSELFKKLGGLS